MTQRRLVIITAISLGVAVVVVALIGFVGHGHEGADHHSSATVPTTTSPTTTLSPGAGLARHAPPTVVVGGSPVQEQYDQAFTQGLGSLPGMSAAAALKVPAPTIAGGWPKLPVDLTPEGWAEAFTEGLLNVDYAHQSRAALGGWLQAQEAPELIPGVPASVADKVLYISLLDPGLFARQPTPVASVAQWSAMARSDVRQSVSDVLVQQDPSWAQLIATGWQPSDVRMTEVDVSGLLSVQLGRNTTSVRIGLQLVVGSARWHDGYGTVAVTGWQKR